MAAAPQEIPAISSRERGCLNDCIGAAMGGCTKTCLRGKIECVRHVRHARFQRSCAHLCSLEFAGLMAAMHIFGALRLIPRHGKQKSYQHELGLHKSYQHELGLHKSYQHEL